MMKRKTVLLLPQTLVASLLPAGTDEPTMETQVTARDPFNVNTNAANSNTAATVSVGCNSRGGPGGNAAWNNAALDSCGKRKQE